VLALCFPPGPPDPERIAAARVDLRPRERSALSSVVRKDRFTASLERCVCECECVCECVCVSVCVEGRVTTHPAHCLLAAHVQGEADVHSTRAETKAALSLLQTQTSLQVVSRRTEQ